MAGPSALVFGTKKSISSTLAKNLQKFLQSQKLVVTLAENPKDIAGKGSFSYAVLVCEEAVPPPTLNVWFKSFSESEKISDRLFLLSKTELPAAWQENLPIESTFEESNYQAVLEEIIDPGKHSQKSEFHAVDIEQPAGDAGGLFASGAVENAAAHDEASAHADEGTLFSSGDLSANLPLDSAEIHSKPTNSNLRPPPPSPKRPPAPTALKIGLPPRPNAPTTDSVAKMMPLPPQKEAAASAAEEPFISLEESAEREEPSIQFDLSENRSTIEEARREDSINLKAVMSASANQATRVSKPLSLDEELPAANPVKLSLPKVPPGASENKSVTGSIRLEALEHPEGTRLNEPLAGRMENVNLDELMHEENLASEESSLKVNLDSSEDPSEETPEGAEDLDFAIGVDSDEPSDTPEMSGSSQSEIKTLEKYLAIKDRELRERESNIKILKGQIKKTDAKLLKSDEARRAQALKLDETQAEIRALREESEQKAFALQKVEDMHREEMKALQARMDGALFEANKAGKRLDEFRERVKQDIQKIRAQERELANKLEIQKRDAEALLAAKDEKLMAQRREIDQLQFELDNLKERLVEETEKAEERSKRLSRALSSLKLAQGMLSGIKEEVIPSSGDDPTGDEGEAA